MDFELHLVNDLDLRLSNVFYLFCLMHSSLLFYTILDELIVMI